MGERIDLPQTPQGTAEEQLRQMYSYLYRMAEALNHNLSEIGSMDLTDDERIIMQQITAEEEGAEAAAYDWQGKESLKSLIIKTAEFVQNKLDNYRLNLLGEYVTEGKFGKYVRNTSLKVDVTPSGIQQDYTFEEVVQGLKNYTVNAKNYIKTGMLRTVGGVPVYGVAIGKDVVTFSEDGTETYNDGNKVAELTADELSFYQSGNKVASYTGSEIIFYQNNTAKVKIDSTGITFLNGTTKLAEVLNTALKFYYNGTLRTQIDTDGVSLLNGNTLLAKFTNNRIGFYSNGAEIMYIDNTGKINTTGSLKISSGGTFEVDSTNFKIDSATKMVTTGDWKLFQNGLVKKYYHDYLQKNIGIAFGDYPAFMEDNIEVVGFTSNIANGVNYDSGIMYLTMKYTDESFGRIEFDVNKEGARIFAQKGQLNGGTLTYIPGTLGWNDGLWDIWGDNIYYNNLVQNSSKDIKHDIQPLPDQGEKLDRLQPVSFVYDNDQKERKRMGLIYEDTMQVMPEICTGDEGNKAINYVELIPMLVKEIQDLRRRVRELEERE